MSEKPDPLGAPSGAGEAGLCSHDATCPVAPRLHRVAAALRAELLAATEHMEYMTDVIEKVIRRDYADGATAEWEGHVRALRERFAKARATLAAEAAPTREGGA